MQTPVQDYKVQSIESFSLWVKTLNYCKSSLDSDIRIWLFVGSCLINLQRHLQMHCVMSQLIQKELRNTVLVEWFMGLYAFIHYTLAAKEKNLQELLIVPVYEIYGG